jgi:uncharacterized repeat protein (TIGR01451 family)
LAILLLGVVLFTHPIPRAVAAPPAKVTPQVWNATAADGETEFLVILDQQADLSDTDSLPTRGARLRYVYETLQETALRTQPSLRAELDSVGADYRPFYIVNMLAVRGDRDLVTHLAARPDVARISANPRVRQLFPNPNPGYERPLAPQGVEWGVARINADDVWALGHTGQSIVVAGQDTGYDWDHPALINQYRGHNGATVTHDYCWHDAIHSGGGVCGSDSPVPCDDNGHGTHTMGTIVGDDGEGNQIGVAPGAHWIGCRNMDQGVGTPATYAECFEFFLAPYPIDGDPLTDGMPSQAPHVINNSWTCPPSEGCDWDTLKMIVENVRTAGIVVIASAGNDGPLCSTVQHPPAIYEAAFSVGATNFGDDIAYFSSRGPVTVDGSGSPKPDVTAPGVGIRSSRRGGGYTVMQGTSMAGPHVAGTVALLWSAAPGLISDVDATEWAITRTTRHLTTTQSCGGDSPADVPNNVYGWGIVDALAAVQQELPRLRVAKYAHHNLSQPDAQVTYTLSVTNTGNVTLTAVVTDVLPTHTTPGGTLTWTPTITAPDGVWTETITVTVEAGYTGPLTNVVRVTTKEGASGVYTHSIIPGLELSKAAALNPTLAGAQLIYTLRVTNTSNFPLGQVVLTDTIPVGSSFAWATGSYTRVEDVITWTITDLGSQEVMTETLAVITEGLTPGTHVTNGTYGARASGLVAPITGRPVDMLVPWRYIVAPILKNWSPEGNGDE